MGERNSSDLTHNEPINSREENDLPSTNNEKQQVPLLPPLVKIIDLGEGDEARIQAISRLLEQEDDRKHKPAENELLVKRLALEIGLPYIEALSAAASRLRKEGRALKRGLLRPYYESSWTNTEKDDVWRDSKVVFGTAKNELVQIKTYEQAIHHKSSSIPDARFKLIMDDSQLKYIQLMCGWNVQDSEHILNFLPNIHSSVGEFLGELNRTFDTHPNGDLRMVEIRMPTSLTDTNLSVSGIRERVRDKKERYVVGDRIDFVFVPDANTFIESTSTFSPFRTSFPDPVAPQPDRTSQWDPEFVDPYRKRRKMSPDKALSLVQGILSFVPTKTVKIN